MLPPSGEQITLAHGDFSAVVTEVGATLRSFRARGEPVIWEFPEDEIASGGRGQVLAPWPNRLEDGSYRFGETPARRRSTSRSDSTRSTASCGGCRGRSRSAPRHGRCSRASIHPQPAYPFRVRLELDYSLGDDGLEVVCAATNTGLDPAPFGLGFHPYLVAGAGGIDEAEIRLVAERRLLLDAAAYPTGEEPVAGSTFDLDGRGVDRASSSTTATPASPSGADGRWHACLEAPGRRSELWADAAFAYAMCFTGDSLARRPIGGGRSRSSR